MHIINGAEYDILFVLMQAKIKPLLPLTDRSLSAV